MVVFFENRVYINVNNKMKLMKGLAPCVYKLLRSKIGVYKRMKIMKNGELNLFNMKLKTLHWMCYHPIFDEIKILDCKYNGLKNLPQFPNIEHIECWGNKLKQLPLWKFIKTVKCQDNQLEGLPLWPTIEEIHCCNNKLIKLPLWPNIKVFVCFDNINEPNMTLFAPFWQNIINFNGEKINKIYKIKRKNFNNIRNMNYFNRKVKMSMIIHELKWRSVNAQINCRPLSGIVWQYYITSISYLLI